MRRYLCQHLIAVRVLLAMAQHWPDVCKFALRPKQLGLFSIFLNHSSASWFPKNLSASGDVPAIWDQNVQYSSVSSSMKRARLKPKLNQSRISMFGLDHVSEAPMELGSDGL